MEAIRSTARCDTQQCNHNSICIHVQAHLTSTILTCSHRGNPGVGLSPFDACCCRYSGQLAVCTCCFTCCNPVGTIASHHQLAGLSSSPSQRCNLQVFSFVLLGDQNAGKSTFLHAFTHYTDPNFLKLSSLVPVLSAGFINTRFLDKVRAHTPFYRMLGICSLAKRGHVPPRSFVGAVFVLICMFPHKSDVGERTMNASSAMSCHLWTQI